MQSVDAALGKAAARYLGKRHERQFDERLAIVNDFHTAEGFATRYRRQVVLWKQHLNTKRFKIAARQGEPGIPRNAERYGIDLALPDG